MSSGDETTQEEQEQVEKAVGTNPGTARIEALSDGVFAIAITILVLELGVPDVPKELAATELPRKLLEFWPGKVLSYMLSFVVIGVLWVSHHMTFLHIQRSDRALLWLNILFLMCVSFIPFPTALAGQYFDIRLPVVLYAATLGLTGLALQAMWWHATRGRRLVARELDPALVAEVTRRNLTGPVIYLLAVVMSFLNVRLSQALLLLVPLLFLLPSPIGRQRPRRSA